MDLYITDTALEVSRSLYGFTTSISHGVEKYFPRLLVLFFCFVRLESVFRWRLSAMGILLVLVKNCIDLNNKTLTTASSF